VKKEASLDELAIKIRDSNSITFKSYSNDIFKK